MYKSNELQKKIQAHIPIHGALLGAPRIHGQVRDGRDRSERSHGQCGGERLEP